MVSFIVRAMLAQVEGDESAYRGYARRFRDMATSLGAEGFIMMAEAIDQ
jgi:hypothetical protein